MTIKFAKRRLMVCCALIFFAGENCFSASKALVVGAVYSFSNIGHIIVNSDGGDIKFLKSRDGITRVHATGPDAERSVISQDGDTLKVENRGGFWGFGFSRRADFLIEVGKSLVPEATISLGNGGIEVKTSVQNLKINAGNLTLYTEDLIGNTDISIGSGVFTFVHKIFRPVSYFIKAGNVQITSLLSHGYRSVSNSISGGMVQLKESSFPIRHDDADFNLSGRVGKAELFFHNID